jgi:FkbM family methyltransferase
MSNQTAPIANLARFFSTHPLTRNAPLAGWARFASWQIRSRLQGEIIVDWIEGQRLAVRRGMTGATGNVYAGLHEFTDMMLALHFLREGDLFLDIGANIGSFTILASGVRGADSWAFEPDLGTAACLDRNIDLNNLRGRVKVFKTALGDSDGTVRFTRGLDTINHVVTDATQETHEVPSARLDTTLGDARPAMIKIDVEGYEEAVLRGAARTLACDSLKLIEIETITPEIATTIENHGFVRRFYDPFTRRLMETSTGLPQSNAIFVRDADIVAARLASAPKVTVLGQAI